jgi:hypothetical protein
MLQEKCGKYPWCFFQHSLYEGFLKWGVPQVTIDFNTKSCSNRRWFGGSSILGRVRKSPYTVDWETLIYCRFHSMMKHVLSLRAELTVLHSPFSTQIEKVKRIENSCYSNQKTSNYGCFNPTSSLETSSTAASLTQPRGLKPVNTMVFLASGLLLGVFFKGQLQENPTTTSKPPFISPV